MIDYRFSLAQVFSEVTRHILNRDRNMRVLRNHQSFQGHRSHDEESKKVDFPHEQRPPSWAIDWRNCEPPNPRRFREESKWQWQARNPECTLTFRGLRVGVFQESAFQSHVAVPASEETCPRKYEPATHDTDSLASSDGQDPPDAEWRPVTSAVTYVDPDIFSHSAEQIGDVLATIEGTGVAVEGIALRPDTDGRYFFVRMLRREDVVDLLAGKPFSRHVGGGDLEQWSALSRGLRKLEKGGGNSEVFVIK
jgi:hypothetical protein